MASCVALEERDFVGRDALVAQARGGPPVATPAHVVIGGEDSLLALRRRGRPRRRRGGRPAAERRLRVHGPSDRRRTRTCRRRSRRSTRLRSTSSATRVGPRSPTTRCTIRRTGSAPEEARCDRHIEQVIGRVDAPGRTEVSRSTALGRPDERELPGRGRRTNATSSGSPARRPSCSPSTGERAPQRARRRPTTGVSPRIVEYLEDLVRDGARVHRRRDDVGRTAP